MARVGGGHAFTRGAKGDSRAAHDKRSLFTVLPGSWRAAAAHRAALPLPAMPPAKRSAAKLASHASVTRDTCTGREGTRAPPLLARADVILTCTIVRTSVEAPLDLLLEFIGSWRLTARLSAVSSALHLACVQWRTNAGQLDASEMPEIDTAAFVKITSVCQHLIDVDLAVLDICNDAVTAIVQRNRRIKRLSLRSKNVSLEGLTDLPDLESLSIGVSTGLTDMTLARVVSGCPKLLELELVCKLVGDETMLALARSPCPLRKLRVFGCVTDAWRIKGRSRV